MRHYRKLLVVTTVITGLLFYIYLLPEHSSQDYSKPAQSQIGPNSTLPDQAIKPVSSTQQYAATEPKSQPVNLPAALSEDAPQSDESNFWDCVPDLTLLTKQYKEEADQYLASLKGSSNLDEMLQYALYANEKEDMNRVDLLKHYLDIGGNHPLAAKNIILGCLNEENENCGDELISAAISADEKNGAIYTYAASYFVAKQDSENAVAAINAMLKTPFYNEYFGEGIKLYIDALAGSNTNSFIINLNSAVSYDFATTVQFSPLITWCKQGNESDEINEACLALGNQMQTRSQSLMSQYIGLALQKNAFEIKHNAVGLQAINENINQLDSERTAGDFDASYIMLMIDERLARNWLANFDSVGELEAQKITARDAKLLYSQDANVICKQIYETFSAFE